MPQLIGCSSVGCVVGAEALSQTSGIWTKVRFYREGNFLCATVYSVAAGEPKVVELRVDIRPIARALMKAHAAFHSAELAKGSLRGDATVGWGLGSLWKGVKKAAKSIGRSKLVKGVVGVTKVIAKGAKAVVHSKITGAVLTGLSVFPLTSAFGAPVLGAYAAANAAVAGVEAGAKVVKTAASAAATISAGVKLAGRVTSQKKQTAAVVKGAGAAMPPQQRAAVAANAKAAGTIKLTAQGKAALSTAIARVPAAARAKATATLKAKLGQLSKLRANAALIKTLPAQASASVSATTKLELGAAPLMAKAAATAKRFQDPAVRKKLLDIRARGEKSEALLSTVKAKASTGDLDAQKSAIIVDLVARNRARIQAMSQANAGGLPGVLITPQGKLVRGRFRVQATANTGSVLYKGRGTPVERGTFATVSGRIPRGGGCWAVNGTVNGDLPLDGIRFATHTPAAEDIGPYENENEDVVGSVISSRTLYLTVAPRSAQQIQIPQFARRVFISNAGEGGDSVYSKSAAIALMPTAKGGAGLSTSGTNLLALGGWLEVPNDARFLRVINNGAAPAPSMLVVAVFQSASPSTSVGSMPELIGARLDALIGCGGGCGCTSCA